MLETLLGIVASLGITGAQETLILAGESLVKKYKKSCDLKKVIAGTGEFFIKNEQDESAFFKDLELAFSKENLSRVVKDLKKEDGYELKQRLYKTFMDLMKSHEIPYEIAESYTTRIIYTLIEQLRTVDPEKYERYYIQEWREEQEKRFDNLQNRIEKISSEMINYTREKIEICSSGNMDLELRRRTIKPSIGIDFFRVDDEQFQDEFENLRHKELVYIRGRCREETMYCILNELWRLNDMRPVYVVKTLDSWNRLHSIEDKGNVYIPCFYADEIVAIEGNTNIFIVDDNTPTFGKQVLDLKPRTRDTLSKKLKDAGLDYGEIESLLSDTHGLYSQMKKKMFNGEYLKTPAWMLKISERAKKTCLLVGSWEEIDGDKLIIENIYGDSYDNFLEEVMPYVKGEDPLLYMINRNGSKRYYLSSVENVWSYLDVLTSEKIWKLYEEMVLLVINESEKLFSYDRHEKIIAQFKGEKLFWSKTIRKGLLKTMLIKGAYQSDDETQNALNRIVIEILNCVKDENQWVYISKFWRELCEISPESVLERMENEWTNDTGLLNLFQNQTSNVIWGRNAYIDILWSVEQFLVQKKYFWKAFRWLLKLDLKQFEYKSNSPMDIFEKIFCSWMNFTPLQNVDEKIKAAEIALEMDKSNAWNYLYSAIDYRGRSIIGELYSPKYREHCCVSMVSKSEIKTIVDNYLKLVMDNMECSVYRWKKILEISCDFPKELRSEVLNNCLQELNEMNDVNVMEIKNEIRHIIYKHRYFVSSEWSMAEENIVEYEELLDKIKIKIPEYEYCYLFSNDNDYSLLYPVPFGEKEDFEKNKRLKEKLIKEKIKDFQELGYDLTVLATICSKEAYSQLGYYLAKYWNEGIWDYSTFGCLLDSQKSGEIALDYLGCFKNMDSLLYKNIIEDLYSKDISMKVIARVYRLEAIVANDVPLIDKAIEQVKVEFWKSSICCKEINEMWALAECKKFSTLAVYLKQVYEIHYRKELSAELIYDCFDDIENMGCLECDSMTSFYIKKLISVIQEAYIYDEEKCIRISHIEVLFMNSLKWEEMKCFHIMIKKSPKLLAQIVKEVFKKDHENDGEKIKNQTMIRNMYTVYDKAHFCPAENDGYVDEHNLKEWIEEYKQLLMENDQESLFTPSLGRLFSFSPIGVDNHEPCEAVRKMIEIYGDEKMISGYQIAVYNRRGVYYSSAGKTEREMAEAFKMNALYLEPDYPKTADIFYGLYNMYKRESDRERMEAVNGWL